MPNPIAESSALIQSIKELKEMIYNLKINEPEMAALLTKQTEDLITNHFQDDIGLVVRMSKFAWREEGDKDTKAVDQSRWHASKACLLGITNTMLDQLRFPDLKKKSPVASIAYDAYKIGFIVLAFIITSYVWWKFKNMNAWLMQYNDNMQLAIYLAGQLFLTCVFAFMIFTGKKMNIIISLASIISSTIALLT